MVWYACASYTTSIRSYRSSHNALKYKKNAILENIVLIFFFVFEVIMQSIFITHHCTWKSPLCYLLNLSEALVFWVLLYILLYILELCVQYLYVLCTCILCIQYDVIFYVKRWIQMGPYFRSLRHVLATELTRSFVSLLFSPTWLLWCHWPLQERQFWIPWWRYVIVYDWFPPPPPSSPIYLYLPIPCHLDIRVLTVISCICLLSK